MEYISKDDERKALEKIRKIIDDLGADSYVAAAFDGCFEMAEQNIENDWACSLKSEVESLQLQNEELHREIGKLQHDVTSTKALYDYSSNTVEVKNAHIKELEDRIQSLMGEVVEADDERIRFKTELEDANDEIICLKAKLYDLISK